MGIWPALSWIRATPIRRKKNSRPRERVFIDVLPTTILTIVLRFPSPPEFRRNLDGIRYDPVGVEKRSATLRWIFPSFFCIFFSSHAHPLPPPLKVNTKGGAFPIFGSAPWNEAAGYLNVLHSSHSLLRTPRVVEQWSKIVLFFCVSQHV